MTLATVQSGTSSILKASSLKAAQECLQSEMVDLVLLDLNLDDTDGLDGLIKLKSAANCPPVFIVSASDATDAIRQARLLGADGYIPKSLGMEQLSLALATALKGENWFPEVQAEQDDEESPAARLSSLTPAQRKVLAYLADGLLNKQIAYEMGISEATVKAHLTTIFRKLHANNRTQALLVYKDATVI
ncbi:MAG: DNA-binding response regulator [Ponticaulis sp.]|nr:DNA-binding response regulator [Ponticaulis sp.]